MADAPACPRGAAFYSCSNGFRGCCSADPCDLPGCPDGGGIGGGHDGGGSASGRRPKPSMTDSGITHTVPNRSVVTVTRHTVVFSQAPAPTPSSAADTLTTASAGPPSTATHPPATHPPASGTAPSSGLPRATAADGTADAEHVTTISSGAVVGIVVGGLLLGVIVIVLLFAWRRRRLGHARPEPDFCAAAGEKTDNHSHRPYYHQHHQHHQHHLQPEPLSAHSASSDPFAPFGGRADRPQDPYAPPAGAFEMDGTAVPPAELPVEPVDQPSRPPGPGPVPVPETPATDPRANLSGLKTDSGHAAYVNHWNQWRALGSAGHQQ